MSIKTTGRTRKLARYVLFELENQLSETDKDYEDDPATIEHILPENSDMEWTSDFPIAIQEKYIYRIGNYTLLEEDKNRECSIKNFSEKKVIYHTSQYALSKYIVSDVWTPNTLEKRQMRLAETATSVWRLSQLD